MGQFANTIFSLMLGWVHTAAAWLWGLATNSNVNAWFRWMLEHWLFLVVLLCIGGAVIDFIVYLVRWQPYRVWRSFLHRLTAKDALEAGETDQPLSQRKWIYADGSTTVEQVQEPVPDEPAADDQLDAPIRPIGRIARQASLEQAYNRPVYPPQWQHTGKNQGEKR